MKTRINQVFVRTYVKSQQTCPLKRITLFLNGFEDLIIFGEMPQTSMPEISGITLITH